ncbi:recombinase RecT, partial [Cysteiniphilum marinum]
KIKKTGEMVWGEFLSMSNVKVRNSPLWSTNPKQQLGYLQVKNWARLYAPGAILGVYTDDEIESYKEPKDITPKDHKTTTAKAYANMIEQKNDVKTDSQIVDSNQDEAVLKQFKINLHKLGIDTPEQYTAFLKHADIDDKCVELLESLNNNTGLLGAVYDEFKSHQDSEGIIYNHDEANAL